jgi:hypothetical protein
LTTISPVATCVQDDSFRRAIEAVGPRQARTASALGLLDPILRMPGRREDGRDAADRTQQR